MIARYLISSVAIATFLYGCVTHQKALNKPTKPVDETTFVYVLNCRYYTQNELTLLGLPVHDSMLLANHPDYQPWADSCASIAQNSFPRYIGGAFDKTLQQYLRVDTTGIFDSTTAIAVKRFLVQHKKHAVHKEDLYGLNDYAKGPIITENLYRHLWSILGF